jgi:hypothetical protein
MRASSTSGTLDSAPWRAAGGPKAPGAKEWKKGRYLQNSKLLIKVATVIITLSTITTVVYRAFWLSRLSAQGHRHVALLFLWDQFAVEDPAEVQAGLRRWAREAGDRFVSARLQSLPQNCYTPTSRTWGSQKSPSLNLHPNCLRRFGWSQIHQTAFGSLPAPGHSHTLVLDGLPGSDTQVLLRRPPPKWPQMVTTVGPRDRGAASCRCAEVAEGLLDLEAGQAHVVPPIKTQQRWTEPSIYPDSGKLMLRSEAEENFFVLIVPPQYYLLLISLCA